MVLTPQSEEVLDKVLDTRITDCEGVISGDGTNSTSSAENTLPTEVVTDSTTGTSALVPSGGHTVAGSRDAAVQLMASGRTSNTAGTAGAVGGDGVTQRHGWESVVAGWYRGHHGCLEQWCRERRCRGRLERLCRGRLERRCRGRLERRCRDVWSDGAGDVGSDGAEGNNILGDIRDHHCFHPSRTAALWVPQAVGGADSDSCSEH